MIKIWFYLENDLGELNNIENWQDQLKNVNSKKFKKLLKESKLILLLYIIIIIITTTIFLMIIIIKDSKLQVKKAKEKKKIEIKNRIAAKNIG